jgi:hypothetical protein
MQKMQCKLQQVRSSVSFTIRKNITSSKNEHRDELHTARQPHHRELPSRKARGCIEDGEGHQEEAHGTNFQEDDQEVQEGNPKVSLKQQAYPLLSTAVEDPKKLLDWV